MQSLWNDQEAAEAVARYRAQGVAEDLALRTYSARLLGREPQLVLHGGGNTSVKTTAQDLFGRDIEVLCVKGSGWDLGVIEPAGHPAVRLKPLLELQALEALSDEDMVNVQRQNLLDCAAPNPSVETLLHAFIADKFVDHTHSTAILALADQPNAAEIFGEIFGDRAPCVPYVMPGFALAKAAGRARAEHPHAEGLVLLKHGMFSFGASAKESYERMIGFVSKAEAYIAREGRRRAAVPSAQPKADATEILPMLRGALFEAAAERWPGRWILDLRGGEAARAVVDRPDLAELADRGVATPDHVIRTKQRPLVLPAPQATAGWRGQVSAALNAYGERYGAYFAAHNARVGGTKRQLDPLPRVIALPGLGLIGIGKSAADAAVAADIAESWAATLLDAETVGRFEPVGEADTFDMEYWSLEQAKLGKAAEKRLARRIVVVTGGAGAIGAATARAFAAEGAELAVIDLDADAATRTAAAIGGRALGLGADLTSQEQVAAAFDAIVRHFGGIDVVVSNAGAAHAGAMADLPDATLRQAFEINFFAHQAVAQAAVRILRAQGMGGALLFNVSKQALNPGPDFGAYGTSKSALLALMRQYALEHGQDGIRVNGLNPDRIRSGLLTDGMIGARSAARGVTPETYMRGNLLGQEVTADDVAKAFVFAALMEKTTGAVIPVDGGNVAAMPR